MQAFDPRDSRRYRTARKRWLPTAEPVCCLCGGEVDMLLPSRYPGSPTVEHTLPVREILAMTETREQAIALACDVSLWSVAHSKCQSRQGAEARNAQIAPRRSSRAW